MKTRSLGRLAALSGMLLALFLLAGAANPAAGAGTTYKWKISQGIAEDHPAAKRARQFADLVREKSGGRINMKYYPAGALGDWMEQIEANRMGTLEVSLNAGATSYDPRMNLMFMPYLFSNWDQVRGAIGSEGWLTPIFDDLYAGIGLKVLGIYLNAWDGMAFTSRVKHVAKTPDQFKGIKIRTPPIRIFETYIPALGFTSTPIAYSETYTALQTGVVDARSACPAVEAYVMRDAIDYWVNTRDAFEYWFLTINRKTWDGLADADKTLLQEVADTVMAEQAKAAESDEQGFISKLKAAGVKVFEVNDAEWAMSARIIREKVWPKLEEEMIGSVLMNRIRANAPAIPM